MGLEDLKKVSGLCFLSSLVYNFTETGFTNWLTLSSGMPVNPKPSYHLYPDFSISPPPNGHLTPGSTLKNPEVDGVAHSLNLSLTIDIPGADVCPRDTPDSKSGFTRTLLELRSVEGSIWAKIFDWDDLGDNLGFLSKRADDETLTVEELFSESKRHTDS